MEFISKYFNAERAESWLFVAVGVIAMGLAINFFFKNDQILRGAAYPLAIVGLIQLVVGGTVLMRTSADIKRVEEIVKTTPTRIQSEEIPRMNVVMKNFVVYRYVEIVLLGIGLLLLLLNTEGSFGRGIGIGLAIQSALMLGLDYFAEKRGHEYVAELQNLI